MAKKYGMWVVLLIIALGVFVDYFVRPTYLINSVFTVYALLAIGAGAGVAFSIVKGKPTQLVGIGVLVGIVFFATGFIATTGILTADAKRAVIGNVITKEFSKEVSPVDMDKLPIVDYAMAYKLADKKLGEEVALGSRAVIGEMNMIQMNEDLVWVAPLLHNGIFKWMNYREGTPAYIMLSATNPNKIELVKEVANEPVLIKYQPNGYFEDLLSRRVYRGHRMEGRTDYSFELDDSGKPYWVVTRYKNKVFLSVPDPIGITVVDPKTGEMKDYGMNDIPEWVDRVIPQNIAIDQINLWGKYVKGFWNFSNTGKLRATEGSSIIYNKGNAFFYTGMTSVSADESTVGFILVNTKTKETVFYKVPGATENAAMRSAEGIVQEKGYKATFPVLISVEGEPTYFIALKDLEGLVKQYAFVNVRNYSVVGSGITPAESKSHYLKKLKSAGQLKISDSTDRKQITGKVQRIGSTIIDGSNYYYLKLENTPQTFIIPLNASPKLPLTMAGDQVFLEYFNTEQEPVDVMSFTNQTIK